MSTAKKPVKKSTQSNPNPAPVSESPPVTNTVPIQTVVDRLPLFDIDRLAILFHEASGRSESKLQILAILAKGERNVAELGSVVELSPSAVSQHLNRLKAHRIVECRRSLHNQIYSLRGDFKDELIKLIENVFKST